MSVDSHYPNFLEATDGELSVANVRLRDTLELLSVIMGIIIFVSCSGGGSGNSHTVITRSWGTAELIETDAHSPQIAMDAEGNAIAMWHQTDGDGITYMMASRFNTILWEGAVCIGSWDRQWTAMAPKIVMNDEGKAIAVWERELIVHYGDYSIWGNHFNGQAWGTVFPIVGYCMDESPCEPDIGMDAAGNAIVVWNISQIGSIKASRFNGVNWESIDGIETGAESLLFVSAPKVAVSAIGSAVAVWSTNAVWANQFDGYAWGHAARIDEEWSYCFDIAINPRGSAITVWIRSEYSNESEIRANRFDGENWGTAERVDEGSGSVHSPQIAMDTFGNAIAVWSQDGGIWVSHYYIYGEKWGKPKRIDDSDLVSNSADPQIGIDSFGNAVVVWSQQGGIRSNHFDGRRWGRAEQITASEADGASNPQLAVNSEGAAIAVWEQTDGTQSMIWANTLK